MATKHKNIAGLRSGRLVAAHYLGNSVWRCSCDCGNSKDVHVDRLQRQSTTSCGCTHGNTTHGMTQTSTYESWKHMHQRCSNPKARQYRWYGAIGVTVDPRWQTFVPFLTDMGERPKGHTLDRIDPNKGYSPDNCRWAPLKGTTRRNTPMVHGMSLKAYAEANGLKYHTAYARWRKGTLL